MYYCFVPSSEGSRWVMLGAVGAVGAEVGGSKGVVIVAVGGWYLATVLGEDRTTVKNSLQVSSNLQWPSSNASGNPVVAWWGQLLAGSLHGGARCGSMGKAVKKSISVRHHQHHLLYPLGIPQNQNKTLPTSPGYHYRMMERKKFVSYIVAPYPTPDRPRCIPSPIPSPLSLGKCISLPCYACILLRRRLVLRCKASPSVCLIAGQIIHEITSP